MKSVTLFFVYLSFIATSAAQQHDPGLILTYNTPEMGKTIAEHKLFVQHHPEIKRAWIFTGEMMFENGEYDSAYYYIQKGLDTTDINFIPDLYLAKYYYIKGANIQAKDLLIKHGGLKYKHGSAAIYLGLMGLSAYYANWETVEGNRITYHFQAATDKEGNAALVKKYEQAYDSLDKIFKTVLPKKPDLFFWNDIATARKVCQGAILTRPELLLTHTNKEQSPAYVLGMIMPAWAWGKPFEQWSNFGLYGLAGFAENGDQSYEAAKQCINKMYFKDVRDMLTSPEVYTEEQIAPIAGGFFYYLYHNGSKEAFERFVKNQTPEGAKKAYSDKFEIFADGYNKLVIIK